MSCKSRIVLCVYCFLFSQAVLNSADDQAEVSDVDSLLKQADIAINSKDWKDGGGPEKLSTTVSRIVERVRRVTMRKTLPVPVKFDSLHGIAADGLHRGWLKNSSLVTKRCEVTRADASIIIAEESVDILFATDCLIITRGSVSIVQSRRNVIIAGQFVTADFDGNAEATGPEGKNGSVIVSGSVANLGFATGSSICAPAHVGIAHANNATLINSPNRHFGRRGNVAELTDESDCLPAGAKSQPLFDDLKITRIKAADDSGEGAEVEVRIGEEPRILKVGDVVEVPTKERVADNPWKLVCISEGCALFRQNDEFATAWFPMR